MVKKDIYSNSFKTTTNKEREGLFKERINYFKSTKNKVFDEKKDNVGYDVFSTTNKKKDFGKNNYFIDKSDGTHLRIYKVKKNLESYSPNKNSELVYSINADSTNLNTIEDGKRVIYYNEKGVNQKN